VGTNASETELFDIDIVADRFYLASIAVAPGNNVDGINIIRLEGPGEVTWSRVHQQCSARNRRTVAVFRTNGQSAARGSINVVMSNSAEMVVAGVVEYANVSEVGNVVMANSAGVLSKDVGPSVPCESNDRADSFEIPIDIENDGSVVHVGLATESALNTIETFGRLYGESGESQGKTVRVEAFDRVVGAGKVAAKGRFGEPNDWAAIAVELRP
ncbi:MAG: hypothetical protein AAGC55_21245, partial [Myxococcota bacterium]